MSWPGVPPRLATDIVGHAALEMTTSVSEHVAVDEQRQSLNKIDGLLDR